MPHLQKIQSNHAFKLLKTMGYPVVNIGSDETAKVLKRMGFKIASVRKNAKSVGTLVGGDINSLLEKHASERGVSKAALIRDVLSDYVGKKNKIV